MQKLLKPGWIFIVNTLPVLVLIFAYFGEFQIIKTLLNEEHIRLWIIFGSLLGVFTLSNIVYGIYLFANRRRVSVYYAVLSLICYIPFVYLYYYYSDHIIPFSAPQWLVAADFNLYVGTFIMPTLIYSLFILVLHFTSADKDYKAWKNLMAAALVPVLYYVFAEVVIPLWKPLEVFYTMHFMLVALLAGVLVFMFFITRSLFIYIKKEQEVLSTYQWVWKIIIAIIFPIMGLTINAGTLTPWSDKANTSGFFGDFSNPWFYILAAVNGLFICLPNTHHPIYRLLLFAGRSITIVYTFYFFLVFLPFLALSVVAILLMLIGLLMLTPLLLFILHMHLLSVDFRFLKTHFPIHSLRAIAIAGVLVIPTVITYRYWQHKITLHSALDYLYQPDYQQQEKVDVIALQQVIEEIKNQPSEIRRNIMGKQQPYLSAYYNWVVLDNLTLSNTKINRIEKVFFGKEFHDFDAEFIQSTPLNIEGIDVKSTYDTTQQAWKSWIHIKIKNNSGIWNTEYATTFELPDGAWISDYYLYVGKKKKPGILAEKKTAMWVYSSIVNTNKDPGILYYLSGNKIALKVFPFLENETRKTGIEILHREPVQINLDGHVIQLGLNNGMEANEIFENKYFTYIPSSQKRQLPQVYRKPYFHFLVDATKKEDIPAYTKRMETLMARHPDLAANGQISLVNKYVVSLPLSGDWKSEAKKQQDGGGFFADRAIKLALAKAYRAPSASYPVFVVVTDSLSGAIFGQDYADWAFTSPEGLEFYNLAQDDVLMRHSLLKDPFEAIDSSVIKLPVQSVAAYHWGNREVAYLRNDSLPGIVLKTPVLPNDDALFKEKNWQSALWLQGHRRRQILHPETTNEEWLSFVKHSFQTKIMTPVTSYIVVETEAQEAILQKKQKQVLSGHPLLDPGEDMERMSEPGAMLMACLMALFWFFWQKRRHQTTLL